MIRKIKCQIIIIFKLIKFKKNRNLQEKKLEKLIAQYLIKSIN